MSQLPVIGTALVVASITVLGSAVVADKNAPVKGLEFLGVFEIPSGGRFPPVLGLRFGGISGLTRAPDGRALLGISDDHSGVRVYLLRVNGEGSTFSVTPVSATYLAVDSAAPARLDTEAIALLPDGNILVASEGYADQEPRAPPALVEYTPQGSFVRQLAVPDRYVPNPVGPQVRGVRPNTAFESLTVAPGGRRVFTATETALVQDGGVATVDHGAQARILEYAHRHGAYVPAREYAYGIEPIHRESFAAGNAINGLVELIAMTDTDLLALERSFVAERDRKGQGANHIRIFRVSVSGASDVSSVESLADAHVVPARKTLLLDLSDVNGLGPALTRLENFEGMAFGPRLGDGRASLILVSDDNFSPTQRTVFLQFAVDR